jgi:hypothetical protein
MGFAQRRGIVLFAKHLLRRRGPSSFSVIVKQEANPFL